MQRRTYPQLGPHGGPGILGPWKKLPPESPPGTRRMRAPAAIAGGIAAAAAIAAHYAAPLI